MYFYWNTAEKNKAVFFGLQSLGTQTDVPIPKQLEYVTYILLIVTVIPLYCNGQVFKLNLN